MHKMSYFCTKIFFHNLLFHRMKNYLTFYLLSSLCTYCQFINLTNIYSVLTMCQELLLVLGIQVNSEQTRHDFFLCDTYIPIGR